MRIILASKSGVRKKILDSNNIDCDVIVSNVDEDEVKASLQSEGADPLTISKNVLSSKSFFKLFASVSKLLLNSY